MDVKVQISPDCILCNDPVMVKSLNEVNMELAKVIQQHLDKGEHIIISALAGLFLRLMWLRVGCNSEQALKDVVDNMPALAEASFQLFASQNGKINFN